MRIPAPMPKLFTDKVVEHNDLSRGRIVGCHSVWAQRVLMSLIAQIDSMRPELAAEYEISVNDIVELNKHQPRIRTVCEELRTTGVVSEFIETNSEYSYTGVNFFKWIGYRRGKIRGAFNPDLKPYLTNLRKNFNEYDRLEFCSLNSFYGQEIYKVLKSWQKQGHVELPVKYWHELLGVPENIRKNNWDFDHKILKPVWKEINSDKTNLRYEYRILGRGEGARTSFTFGDDVMIVEARKAASRKRMRQERLEKLQIQAEECWFKIKHKHCEGQTNKPVICKNCNRWRVHKDCERMLREKPAGKDLFAETAAADPVPEVAAAAVAANKSHPPKMTPTQEVKVVRDMNFALSAAVLRRESDSEIDTFRDKITAFKATMTPRGLALLAKKFPAFK